METFLPFHLVRSSHINVFVKLRLFSLWNGRILDALDRPFFFVQEANKALINFPSMFPFNSMQFVHAFENCRSSFALNRCVCVSMCVVLPHLMKEYCSSCTFD